MGSGWDEVGWRCEDRGMHGGWSEVEECAGPWDAVGSGLSLGWGSGRLVPGLNLFQSKRVCQSKA